MKIHGTEITQDQIDACIKRMKSGPFKSCDIAEAAEEAGVSKFLGRANVSFRVADRLIQKMRLDDKITLSEPYPTWTWK